MQRFCFVLRGWFYSTVVEGCPGRCLLCHIGQFVWEHINTSIYGSWRKSRCSFKGCWKVLPCRYPHTHHSCQQCPDNGPLKLYLICFIYMFSFSIIYCPLSYKLGSLFSYFSLNLQRIRNQWQNFWNYLSYTIKLLDDYLQTFAFPHGQNTENRNRPEAGPPKAAKTLDEIWKHKKSLLWKR